MKISLLAILGLAQLFSAVDCSPAGEPRLWSESPQGWKVTAELVRSGRAMLVLNPEKAGLEAGFGVICAPAGKMPPEVRFRSLARQAREMAGAVDIEAYDAAKKFFVLSYAYESVSGEAYVARVTVKTDSSGLGQTLVISGYWPEAVDPDLARVYADFVASIDFK
ncbi:MAG: hypothetical protein WCT10_03025 [Patescibacteria group bacterium]|jgi:hypothetical protein